MARDRSRSPQKEDTDSPPAKRVKKDTVTVPPANDLPADFFGSSTGNTTTTNNDASKELDFLDKEFAKFQQELKESTTTITSSAQPIVYSAEEQIKGVIQDNAEKKDEENEQDELARANEEEKFEQFQLVSKVQDLKQQTASLKEKRAKLVGKQGEKAVKKAMKKKDDDDDDNDDEDDSDIDEFADWRKKKIDK